MTDRPEEAGMERAAKEIDGGRRRGPAWSTALVLALLFAAYAPGARAGIFDDAVSGELEEGSPEEGDAAGGGAAPLPEPLAYELNGYVRATMYAGKRPEKDVAEIKNAYGEPALKLRIRKGSYGDALAEVRFRHGYQGNRVKTELDLREAYVNLYPWLFDIRLGHQVIVWGRADGFNPTNNLTPLSMRIRSPNEDDQRLANIALRTFFNYAPIRLEGAWVPLYRPTEIPELPFPDFVTLQDEFPSASLKNGVFAGRLHLELPAVGMSISYLHGFAPMPGVVPGEVSFPEGAPSISLLRKPYRHHVAGFDFALPVSDLFGLRGEAAYRHPLHYENHAHVPNPDIQYVAGVDREFGDIYLIAQYVGRHALDWHVVDAEPMSLSAAEDIPEVIPEPMQDLARAGIEGGIARTNQMIQSQTERWQHSAFLRAEWRLLHETLSLEVSGLYNFSTSDWMARPRLSYDITDALEVMIGGEIFGGPDDTLFGMIEEIQSAGYAQVMASF
jgi:hypothetical protein